MCSTNQFSLKLITLNKFNGTYRNYGTPKVVKVSSLSSRQNYGIAKSDIKVIATDVDGTLLDTSQNLSQANEEAIKLAADQGVQAIIATGKAKGPWAEEVFSRLNVNTPAVFLQGLLIYDTQWNILYESKMDVNVAREVVEIGQELGVTQMIYSNDRILCEVTNHHTDRMIGYKEPTPEAVGPLNEIIGHVPVHKILYASSEETLNSFREGLETRLGGRATVVKALDGFLEILPPGTSKGKGVKWVLDFMGLHPANLLALGDGENDVEMLEMAGIGVAMANADRRVKSFADFVTDNNDADGVARAVEMFVLKPLGTFQ